MLVSAVRACALTHVALCCVYNLCLLTKAHPLPYLAAQLEPGDALVIRGDTLHRTEDLATLRTVLSLRISSSHSRAKLENLLSGSDFKVRTLALQNPVWLDLATALALCGPTTCFSSRLGDQQVAKPREFLHAYARRSPAHFLLAHAVRPLVWARLLGTVLLNALRNSAMPATHRDGYRIGESWGALIPSGFDYRFIQNTPH